MNKLKEKKVKKLIYKSTKNFNIQFLIKIGFIVGHSKVLTKTSYNALLSGFRDNLGIINPNLSIFSLKNLESFFILLFSSRLKGILAFFNNTIIEKILYEDLLDDHIKNITPIFYLKKNLLGFIKTEWIGGILSNWSVLYFYIKNLIKLHNSENLLTKKQQKELMVLIGILNRKPQPTFPDWIFFLGNSYDILNEVLKLKIPVISLNDSNSFIEKSTFSVLGNDDSIESLLVLFLYLNYCAQKAFLIEQELFYFKVLKSLKNLI